MMPADSIAETYAAALDRLGEQTGDRKFSAAANVLRGVTFGRPVIDDAEALREIEALLADGTADKFNAAANLVAARMPGQSQKATVERLRRKHRACKKEESTKVKCNANGPSGA